MKPKPIPEHILRKNAIVYKIMANPLRLGILNILAQQETTLMELCELLGKRKSNISQHLSLMGAYGLVHSHRSGKQVIYSISNPHLVDTCKQLTKLFEEST